LKYVYNKMLKTLAKRTFSKRGLMPAILSDIDGVVYRGGHEIGNSRFVIDKILQSKLPFALLTNGGGVSESERARYISHVIGLDS
jgi:ribonucleotide monophosphatase NagD (HAD superfamily)